MAPRDSRELTANWDPRDSRRRSPPIFCPIIRNSALARPRPDPTEIPARTDDPVLQDKMAILDRTVAPAIRARGDHQDHQGDPAPVADPDRLAGQEFNDRVPMDLRDPPAKRAGMATQDLRDLRDREETTAIREDRAVQETRDLQEIREVRAIQASRDREEIRDRGDLATTARRPDWPPVTSKRPARSGTRPPRQIRDHPFYNRPTTFLNISSLQQKQQSVFVCLQILAVTLVISK